MKKPWMNWTDRLKANKPYLIINLSFGVSIILILVYAAIFSPEAGNHPLPCLYTSLTGEPCASCGLSRGLSYAIRGQFPEAMQINVHSIPVFVFFILQLLLRTAISLVLLKTKVKSQRLILPDALAGVISFLAVFAPMLK